MGVQKRFRFKVGRDGDMLQSSFQCDLCWFRNLTARDPTRNRIADKYLFVFIRRKNLDIFWSRSVSTVQSIKGSILKFIRMCEELTVTPTNPLLGPCFVKDTLCFIVALQILKSSLLPENTITLINDLKIFVA